MAGHDWGNPPINSTGAVPIAAGSTTALFAELDSTRLGTAGFKPGQKRIFEVRYTVGGDTNITWQCGACSSTDVGSGTEEMFVKTPTGQSGQYLHYVTLQKDYRIRVRQQSTGANGAAYITAIAQT